MDAVPGSSGTSAARGTRVVLLRVRDQVNVALGAGLQQCCVLQHADLGAIDLADAVAAGLDLLRREVRLVGDEADLARDAASRRAVELELDTAADADLPHGRDRQVDL